MSLNVTNNSEVSLDKITNENVNEKERKEKFTESGKNLH